MATVRLVDPQKRSALPLPQVQNLRSEMLIVVVVVVVVVAVAAGVIVFVLVGCVVGKILWLMRSVVIAGGCHVFC